jgi:hypothetical protein
LVTTPTIVPAAVALFGVPISSAEASGAAATIETIDKTKAFRALFAFIIAIPSHPLSTVQSSAPARRSFVGAHSRELDVKTLSHWAYAP